MPGTAACTASTASGALSSLVYGAAEEVWNAAAALAFGATGEAPAPHGPQEPAAPKEADEGTGDLRRRGGTFPISRREALLWVRGGTSVRFIHDRSALLS